MDPHMYCINLERDKERRAVIEKEFEREGLDVEFVKAFDVKVNGITKDSVRPEIHPGDFGCLMSHHMVRNDMITKGYPTALIMEDDIKLVPGFKNLIKNLELPKEWDIIYLEYISPIHDGPATRDVSEGRCLGTMCYLISEAGARKLVAFDPKDWRGADKQLAQIPLKSFYANKRLAKHDLLDLLNTTIGLDPNRIPIFHNALWFFQEFGSYLGIIIIMVLLFMLYIRNFK
jgi:hypothetical protein